MLELLHPCSCNGKAWRRNFFFFFFCKKLMFWFCLLLQPFYQLTLDRCGYFLRMVHSQWEGILLYGHQIKTAVLHSNSLKKKSSFVSWLFVFFLWHGIVPTRSDVHNFWGFGVGSDFLGGLCIPLNMWIKYYATPFAWLSLTSQACQQDIFSITL